MPNLGAFIAWGLITALFIPTGWLPNASIAQIVGPMIKILLPLLIGYTGGRLVHGQRGAVVGAVATMGLVIGADVPMLLGAMIIGPLTAYILKLFDGLVENRIRPGFEMLVDNFSAGIIGGAMAIGGLYGIGPVAQWLTRQAGHGADWLVSHDLLPLTSVLVEPAKVLFLNNAINHGVLGPLGVAEAADKGKSILFMIESNPGPGLGLLLAFMLFGPRALRPSVPAAIIVQFLGGIHEIYFPYVLMKPKLILAMICGGASGVGTFMITGAGLVATPSPGSIFAYMAVTPHGGYVAVLLGIAISAAVTFAVASPLLALGHGEPAPEAGGNCAKPANVNAKLTERRRNRPCPPRSVATPHVTAPAAGRSEATRVISLHQQLTAAQTALQRIAVLVACGATGAAVFNAVAKELGQLVGADTANIIRYETDGTATAVAAWSRSGTAIPVGTNMPLEGRNVAALVLRSGRSTRIDNFADAHGALAALIREHGIRSTVGAPIYVEGRLWGLVTASMMRDELLAPHAETRLADYTHLVAIAIANAQARADLAASRARTVIAADQARRRIERNLHDGVQQQLLALALQIRETQASVPPEMSEVREQLSAVTSGLTGTFDDLREISRGVHPAILSEGGLRPALRTLARRSCVAVDLSVHLDERLPEPVEVAAYYVVAETLANAIKHADASLVHVEAAICAGRLNLSIDDDGVGDVDPARGSGLIGLVDRVEALGGTITISSPAGQGTHIRAELPIQRWDLSLDRLDRVDTGIATATDVSASARTRVVGETSRTVLPE
ncbi:PTS transporter subunit EIIC [Dactylosporangium sp. NBC_01737]|nr:PTS transporter subunit EIIC [Dactylosporangium sp. NBC_01737]